ncbi:MAG: HelD family protein [Nocardioidaceae bacterium]
MSNHSLRAREPGDSLSARALNQSLRERAGEQEIKHEQAIVDHIYTRLEAAARSARALAAEGHARARLGNEGGLVERDAIVFQAGRRLATLDTAHEGLVFGRLDMRDAATRYIGRLGLRDADREVLLIDWRAPAAAVFYQATAQDPAGVVRRRVLQCAGDKVVGIEDDLLDADAAGDDLVVVGEGALLAALSRSRDRSMHSIVATIQREQDNAIRAPHRGVTAITGGPGTGKTVVALHRAAYLLYSDRRRYETGGVLVVGPNETFMSYIERVLPSLGETSVSLRALGDLVDGVEATRHDSPRVAVIKGSDKMRPVLARTARGATPGAPSSFRVFYRDDVLALDARDLREIRRALLGSGQRRNQVASRVADELVTALWRQIGGERAIARGKADFAATMHDSSALNDFIRAWWPAVDAMDVLGWLADRDRLRRDSAGVLTHAEVDELVGTWGAGDFSIEDVPLLDEMRYLVGDPPQPEGEIDPLDELYDDTLPELSTQDERGPNSVRRSERPTASIDDDSYAHVLVDEAQDLSPMQWRMVGRRGRRASWTIVGDAAQSSWPLPAEAAQAREVAFGRLDRSSFRLSTNYRNSREIFELAADLARAQIPDADLPVAVRSTGVQPQIETVLRAQLPVAVRAAADRLTQTLEGTVGVVVSTGWADRVESWLRARADQGAGQQRVRVLEALDTKGLEFDGIVVVEPDEIVAESRVGTHTLYVVLTRATQRLHVLGTSNRWRL